MGMSPGIAVVGKWSKKRVMVEKKVGSGANGEVYLARFEGQLVAMKVSNTAADIAMEWAVLTQVSQKGNLLPRPLLMDDALVSGEPVYFYLMEWVEGRAFDEMFLKLSSLERIHVVEQIFAGLEELHQIGYAFCDIKPQNILVQQSIPPTVRFVDVGGVTTFGRSVRQFTPLYDRGFWGLGGRQSEPSYDVVGAMLLVICVQNGQSATTISKLSVPARQKWVRRAVQDIPDVTLRSVLLSVLDGRITKASEAQMACRHRTSGKGTLASARTSAAARPFARPSKRTKASTSASSAASRTSATSASPATPRRTASPASQQKTAKAAPIPSPSAGSGHRGKHKMDWTERLMWVSLSMAFSAACLAWVTILR